MRDIKKEEYLGGAIAISRHISEFCNNISLLSMVGEKGEFLKNILKNLPKNVDFRYIKKKNSPTIIKKRFLDNSTNNNNKILGVYTINDDLLIRGDEKKFAKLLKKEISNHDLIIISDYGHGLISDKSAKSICKKSLFLALNAQVNASNIGYHTMDKYKNVECVVINETELRHETRNKSSPIKLLMKKFS